MYFKIVCPDPNLLLYFFLNGLFQWESFGAWLVSTLCAGYQLWIHCPGLHPVAFKYRHLRCTSGRVTFKYRHWKFPVDYCKTWIFFLLLFCFNVIVIYSIVLSWVFVFEVSVFVIVIFGPTLPPCKTSASCYWSLCKETGKPLINLPFFFSSRKLHKFPIKIVMMMMMTTSSHDDDDDNGNQPTCWW